MVIPAIVAIVAHWLIVGYIGFARSGEIAFVMAWTSIISVLFSLRTDVKILSQNSENIVDDLVYGTLVILAFTLITLLSVQLIFIDQPLNKYILVGSLSAFTELFLSLSIRNKKIWSYVIVRATPYFFVVMIVLLMPSIATIDLWIIFSFIGFLLSILINKEILFQKSSQFRVQEKKIINFLHEGLMSTVASLLGVGMANLLVIVISYTYGDAVNGMWTNVYRVVSLPLVYMISINQYGVLLDMADHRLRPEKFLIGLQNWFNLSKYILIYVAVMLVFGSLVILSTDFNRLSFNVLFAALIVGVYRSLAQYIESLSQAIQRSNFALFFYLIELIALFFCVLMFMDSSEKFLTVLSMIFLVIILLTNWIFYKIYHRLDIS